MIDGFFYFLKPSSKFQINSLNFNENKCGKRGWKRSNGLQTDRHTDRRKYRDIDFLVPVDFVDFFKKGVSNDMLLFSNLIEYIKLTGLEMDMNLAYLSLRWAGYILFTQSPVFFTRSCTVLGSSIYHIYEHLDPHIAIYASYNIQLLSLSTSYGHQLVSFFTAM